MSYEEFSKYFNLFNCVKPINPEYNIKMVHCKLESPKKRKSKKKKITW